MLIEVKVLSFANGLPVEGRGRAMGAPATAIFLADEYSKQFRTKTHEVRIFVSRGTKDGDRADLHAIAQDLDPRPENNPAGSIKASET